MILSLQPGTKQAPDWSWPTAQGLGARTCFNMYVSDDALKQSTEPNVQSSCQLRYFVPLPYR